MSITSITASRPRLIEPAEHPPGETCRYGVAFPFQVASETAGVLCCLRNEGYPAGDFENGSDVFLFDRLDGIDPAAAIPIVRNDKYVDTRGQRRIAIHYPVVGGFGLFGSAFVALAVHLVAVPAVVADKLKALVGDVLGDGGDEVARAEDLEVALDLRVEAGAVDDGAVGVGLVRGADLHLLHGERVADDVLGQALQILALVGQHPAAPIIPPYSL